MHNVYSYMLYIIHCMPCTLFLFIHVHIPYTMYNICPSIYIYNFSKNVYMNINYIYYYRYLVLISGIYHALIVLLLINILLLFPELLVLLLLMLTLLIFKRLLILILLIHINIIIIFKFKLIWSYLLTTNILHWHLFFLFFWNLHSLLLI